jgi:hypothetical protein
VTPEEKQAVLDEEHLRLLAISHYISGGVTVVLSMLGSLWSVVVGSMFTAFPMPPQPGLSEEAARQMQVMPKVMLVVFGLFAAAGLTYGILEIISGRCIRQRRGRVFTQIVALPRLVFFPWGTALSIVTLMVLERGSVEALYRSGAAASE